MKIIDLTHTITETMPVYPGTEPPKLEVSNTYEEHGFKETLLTMFSHTGTHMDAPSHIFAHRTTLDKMPPEQFIGTALVIDCRDSAESRSIDISYIDAVRDKADQAEFLLFYTGWDQKWGTPSYFEEYPCITQEVADYLTVTGKKGIGLDTIGLDPVSDGHLTLHRRLLKDCDMVIIENLTHLDEIGSELCTFFALPLKYQNSDGAPIRAMAMISESLDPIKSQSG